MTALIPGYDNETCPTTKPAGAQFGFFYGGGVNVAHIWTPAERERQQGWSIPAGMLYVGQTTCPRNGVDTCDHSRMTATQGALDGADAVTIARATGAHTVCPDYEPGTEAIAGYVAYATAFGRAVQAAKLLHEPYGLPSTLAPLYHDAQARATLDGAFLCWPLASGVPDAVVTWWLGAFSRVCWQYAYPDIDLDLATQTFVDGLSGMTAGVEVPVTPPSQTFPATGKTLAHGFYAYWSHNGGLPIFGLPITDEQQETLSDGKPHTVQYTERARLEWWPGTDAANFDVRLGRVGSELLAARSALASAPKPPDLTAVRKAAADLDAALTALP